MQLDVLVAGEVFVDLIFSGLDGWPEPGKEVFAKGFCREVGGAAIPACGLATLGTRAGLICGVGDAWIVERLRQKGVDTSSMICDSTKPTAITVAITTPGDRAFLTYQATNFQLPNRVSNGRHLHLACAPDSLPECNCTISLDPGWQEPWLANPRTMELLPQIDILFLNRVEAQRMTGAQDPKEMLTRLAGAGAKRIALKLGADGAALLWDGKVSFARPPQVTPIDPTGAGDCFDAGFLHMWLKGESPETCLRAANICGALSTEALGGIAAFPTAQRLAQEVRML